MMNLKSELGWQIEMFPYRLGNMRDNVYAQLARMLPKRLVYYAAIRMFVFATTDKYGNTVVPELTVMDALQRWAGQYDGKPPEPTPYPDPDSPPTEAVTIEPAAVEIIEREPPDGYGHKDRSLIKTCKVCTTQRKCEELGICADVGF